MALIIVCAYYVLLAIGAGMARDGSVPPWLGVWGADIAVGLAGLALTVPMLWYMLGPYGGLYFAGRLIPGLQTSGPPAA